MKRSRDDVGKLNPKSKLTVSDARQYMEEVKSKLKKDKFFEFIVIMKDYKAYRIDIPGVKAKLMQMFEGNRELLEGLNVFLPKESRIVFKQEEIVMHCSSSSLTKTRSLHSEEETIYSHEHGESAEKAPAQIRKNKRSATGGRIILGSKQSLVSCKHKKKEQAIQTLNHSDDDNYNPSYRSAPKDYSVSEASQRTEMDKQVLNDRWVCGPYKSKDRHFKPSVKNQYEKILFRFEDERFEMDMVLERIKVAIKQAEILRRRIYEECIKTDGVFCLEDYFSGQTLRCIKNLYGDQGLDMVNELRNNVSCGLPIILERLKQKQEELMMFRSKLTISQINIGERKTKTK